MLRRTFLSGLFKAAIVGSALAFPVNRIKLIENKGDLFDLTGWSNSIKKDFEDDLLLQEMIGNSAKQLADKMDEALLSAVLEGRA